MKTSVAGLLMLAGGINSPPERVLFVVVVLMQAMASTLQEIPKFNGFRVGGGLQTVAERS